MTPLENERAEKASRAIIDEWNALRAAYPQELRGWRLQMISSARNMGVCCYKSKAIQLSVRFLMADPQVATIIDTLRHEVAHVLAGPRANHGPVWKEWAVKLGASPKACGSMSGEADEIPHKYELAYVEADGSRTVVRKYYFKRPDPQAVELAKRVAIKGRPETRGKLQILPRAHVYELVYIGADGEVTGYKKYLERPDYAFINRLPQLCIEGEPETAGRLVLRRAGGYAHQKPVTVWRNGSLKESSEASFEELLEDAEESDEEPDETFGWMDSFDCDGIDEVDVYGAAIVILVENEDLRPYDDWAIEAAAELLAGLFEVTVDDARDDLRDVINGRQWSGRSAAQPAYARSIDWLAKNDLGVSPRGEMLLARLFDVSPRKVRSDLLRKLEDC